MTEASSVPTRRRADGRLLFAVWVGPSWPSSAVGFSASSADSYPSDSDSETISGDSEDVVVKEGCEPAEESDVERMPSEDDCTASPANAVTGKLVKVNVTARMIFRAF